MSRRVVAAADIEAARIVASAHLGVPAGEVSLERLQERRADRPIFRASAGDRELVTKQYVDDAFLAISARRLAAAAPLAAAMEIPRLLGVDAARRVFVMSLVRGEPLLDRLAAPDGDPGGVSERAGIAIATVHASGIPFPGRRTREELIDHVRAAAFLEEDGARFGTGFPLAERLLAAAPAGPLVPTHGDLGPDQMLVCGERIGLLDFDKAVTAEAARDLGYFLAHLLRDVPERAHDLWGRFLGGYATRADVPPANAIHGFALLVLLRKLARSTAPRPESHAATDDGRPRTYRTANRIRPAVDRILQRGGLALAWLLPELAQ